MPNPAAPYPCPVIGFAASSGSGKTTLISALIPLLREKGLRVAIIKHSHHDFEIDKPGKDSYQLHHAGSEQTLLISKYRSALVKENTGRQEPLLAQAIAQLDLDSIDLVLVEGFRHDPDLPSIELNRPALARPLLFPDGKNIIAVASDADIETSLPKLDINQPQQIALFILEWMKN
jgi:molybdopterin-guanine dinucleotide biosynthesis protein MobB